MTWRRAIITLALAWPLAVMAEGLSSDQAKAAYVFNFIKFVAWPNDSVDVMDMPLTLCVMGSESLSEVLGALDGRMAGNHKLRVMRQMQYGDDLKGCQVVVIGMAMQSRMTAILREMDDAPILTISALDGFAEKGGCIGLLQQEGRMLFEVNLAALRRKRLQLPSQVLNLASNVYGK